MTHRYSEARSSLEATLVLYQELGNRRGRAGCLWCLGEVLRETGRYTEAQSSLEAAAAALYEELGDRLKKEECLRSLGALLALAKRVRKSAARLTLGFSLSFSDV